MSWSLNVYEAGLLLASSFLGGGVSVAIVQGFFNKPKERALTRSVETDTSIDLVRLWMDTNDKLLESNKRLERSNERIQKSNERLQREVGDTKRVLIALVDVVERFIDGSSNVDQLSAALARARVVSNGGESFVHVIPRPPQSAQTSRI